MLCLVDASQGTSVVGGPVLVAGVVLDVVLVVGVVVVVVGVVAVCVLVGVVTVFGGVAAVVVDWAVVVLGVVLVGAAGVVIVIVVAGLVAFSMIGALPKKVVCRPLPVIECPARRSGTVNAPTTAAKASSPVATASRQRGRRRVMSSAFTFAPGSARESTMPRGSARRVTGAGAESVSVPPGVLVARRIDSLCAPV